MKTRNLAVVFIFIASGLFAQMDFLPEIFRELPQEWSQGLPQGMSYKEYRMAMRNVDLMTMGMSMMIPGYGFFQVERPLEGSIIVAGRFAGMGLMGYAMFDQWRHLGDLFQLDSLGEDDLNRVLGNTMLFMGGMFLQFMGWGIDVVGAYHYAKAEKDWVYYKYGMGDYQGPEDPQSLQAYLLRLMAQDDTRLRAETTVGWRMFANLHFDSQGIGMAYEYLTERALEENRFLQGFFLASRGMVSARSQDYRDRNQELAHRSLYFSFLPDQEKQSVSALLANLDGSMGWSAYPDFLRKLAGTQDSNLALGVISEIRYLLANHPELMPREEWFPILAQLWETAGNMEQALLVRDYIRVLQ